MPQRLTLAIALALAIWPVGCRRSEPAPAPAAAVEAPTEAITAPAAPAPAQQAVSGGCALPVDGKVTRSLALSAGCRAVIARDLEVGDGATLTLQAGVRLAFEPGVQLRVDDGALVAQGTVDEPVLLTSANAAPAPGDWTGIVFESGHRPGTTLAFTTVEFAGHQSAHGLQAGLQVAGAHGDKRIAVAQSTFRANLGAGLYDVDDKGAFARFEGNTFMGNGTYSLHVRATHLNEVTDSNRFDRPILVSGDVDRSTRWPRATVAFVLEGNLLVGGDGTPSLTIPEGATVRVKQAHHIAIGTGDGGGLVARRVVFTSASNPAGPGDWYAIHFLNKATTSSLEGATVAFAGRATSPHGAEAALWFESADVARKVTLRKVRLKMNKKGIFAPGGACRVFEAAEAGNEAEGTPLCDKAN